MNHIIFPHIRYLSAATPNRFLWFYKILGFNITKVYMGVDANLTRGKSYGFRLSKYSPDKNTEYSLVFVTMDDNNSYINIKNNKDFYPDWE